MSKRKKRNMRERKNKSNARQNMYIQQLSQFEYKTVDQDLIKDFEKFMMNNLDNFITHTDEIKITVTDLDLRSALRGKHNSKLKELANTQTEKASNKSTYKEAHQQKSFRKILETASSFQKMMNNVNVYLSKLEETDKRWNKVWYGTFLGW